MICLGPTIPVAFSPGCPPCHGALVFEMSPFRRAEWTCRCEGCDDGEYTERGLRMTNPRGFGDSPWDALDYFAGNHFDLFAEDLLERRESA